MVYVCFSFLKQKRGIGNEEKKEIERKHGRKKEKNNFMINEQRRRFCAINNFNVIRIWCALFEHWH